MIPWPLSVDYSRTSEVPNGCADALKCANASQLGRAASRCANDEKRLSSAVFHCENDETAVSHRENDALPLFASKKPILLIFMFLYLSDKSFDPCVTDVDDRRTAEEDEQRDSTLMIVRECEHGLC